MAVPTSFSDLSTTAASNSPSGSETPAEGDNHFRITYAFLRSILDNSGNGWVSPYWALTATGPSISATTVTWSGNPTHSGNHTFSGNVTVQGNTTLGNGGTDTTTTNGNITLNAPTSGTTLTVSGLTAGGTVLNVEADASNAIVTGRVSNQHNANAGSHARLLALSGGASGGDAYTEYQISGVQSWVVGVDNSASDTFKIDASSGLGSATNWLNITTDGRIYGTALHNNAGSLTGTTNHYIASSDNTTPTVTSITNLTGTPTAAYESMIRVGNKVTVTGSLSGVTVTSTGSAATVQLTTPMNMAGSQTLARLVGRVWDSGTTTGQSHAWVSATQIQLGWTTSTSGSHSVYYEYSFIVG